MVHQFMSEAAEQEHAPDGGYGVHGPRFHKHGDRIGRELGLGSTGCSLANCPYLLPFWEQ